MKILITGGFGFIGSHLAPHLVACGHEVRLGTRDANQLRVFTEGWSVTEMRWNYQPSLLKSCDGIDIIVHAAGVSSEESSTNPLMALEANGLATERLVSAAIASGVKFFIYLSTAHVYASPLTGCISEDSCPRNLHPYATSHLAGENAVRYAARERGLPGVVLRISNGIGPVAHPYRNYQKLLANDLCEQAVSLRCMRLRTSGEQERDFITMDDIVGAISHLIRHQDLATTIDIVNIGSGRSMTVLSMAELIQNRYRVLFGSSPEVHRVLPAEPVPHDALDYRIDRLLCTGYVPKNNVAETIDTMLEQCAEALSIN